jgi:hypothetical protein
MSGKSDKSKHNIIGQQQQDGCIILCFRTVGFATERLVFLAKKNALQLVV